MEGRQKFFKEIKVKTNGDVMKTPKIKPHKMVIFLLLIIILIHVPPAEALDRAKLLDGNFSNPLYVAIPPNYRAEWVDFVFTTNGSCNASARYTVYQYGEIVRGGSAKIKWLGKNLYVNLPLELYDHFTIRLFPNFSCEMMPEGYRLYATLDIRRLTDLSIKTEKAVEYQEKGGITRTPPLELVFNASGKLLGIDARLYKYRGSEVSGTLRWKDGSKNFTVSVKDGWIWISGGNISEEVTLYLNLPPNASTIAVAYYLNEEEQINEDLLIKDWKNRTQFDFPFGGRLWDTGYIDAWFELMNEGDVLVFDFGNGKASRVFVKDNKACIELYTLYYGKKKECFTFSQRRIHRLKVYLMRIPNGERILEIWIDGENVFEEKINSPIGFGYFGDAISLISLDASVHKNPDYYVVPPDNRKANIAIGISILALMLSVILWIHEKRK